METVGLWQLAEEQQPYMTAMRRLFHTEPELSGREFKTRETLCKELTDMGVPYTLLPGTGLIAQVKGRLPDPSRLLRSDMDALPLEELPATRCRRKYACPETGGSVTPVVMTPIWQCCWERCEFSQPCGRSCTAQCPPALRRGKRPTAGCLP